VLIEQAGIPCDPTIFFVSARLGLDARQEQDVARWKASGMEYVEEYLIHFLVSKKNETLFESLFIKTGHLLSDFMMRIQLEIQSLQMPLRDLENRLQLFEEQIEKTQHEKLILHDLMAGERKRLTALLEDQAKLLRTQAKQYLLDQIDGPDSLSNSEDETQVQERLTQLIPIFFERELGESSRDLSRRMEEILQPHYQRANEVIHSLKKSTADLFEIPFHGIAPIETFRMERQPYWVTHKWSSGFIPISSQRYEFLLPRRLRIHRHRRRMEEYIDSLVLHNVENLRWAALQNLNQAFRRFIEKMDQQLQETISLTRQAIEAACQKKKTQSQSVAEELARKTQWLSNITNLYQNHLIIRKGHRNEICNNLDSGNGNPRFAGESDPAGNGYTGKRR
jgi:ribosomal protein L16 Arg81 hydroxylase